MATDNRPPRPSVDDLVALAVAALGGGTEGEPDPAAAQVLATVAIAIALQELREQLGATLAELLEAARALLRVLP